MTRNIAITLCIFFLLLCIGCTAEQLATADSIAETAGDVSAAAGAVISNPVVTSLVPAPIVTIAGYIIAAIGGISTAWQTARKRKYATAVTEIVKGIELYKQENESAKAILHTCLERKESAVTEKVVKDIKSSVISL